MRVVLLSALLSAVTASAYADNWFESSTPLVTAHQNLLDNDLAASFAAITQVWQTDTSEYVKGHLNDLLLKSLESDCGKSLSAEPLAPWLRSVVIRRQALQSPGRRSSKAIVEISAQEEIRNIKLMKWPETSISSEADFVKVTEGNVFTYQMRYDLSQRLSKGLYRIEVINTKDELWSSWIVIGESSPKQVVRWDSKDTWAVDKLDLLNPYCALPILTVSLYDYVDGEYIRVWHNKFEGDYPNTLPLEELKADRYVLAVSMTHQRWQGSVVIEDQQVISKTYDITSE